MAGRGEGKGGGERSEGRSKEAQETVFLPLTLTLSPKGRGEITFDNTVLDIVKGFMKNRSGTYGKTRGTLPLVEDPAELWRGGGRARVGVKELRG